MNIGSEKIKIEDNFVRKNIPRNSITISGINDSALRQV
jgi:hypothetical protein